MYPIYIYISPISRFGTRLVWPNKADKYTNRNTVEFVDNTTQGACQESLLCRGRCTECLTQLTSGPIRLSLLCPGAVLTQNESRHELYECGFNIEQVDKG